MSKPNQQKQMLVNSTKNTYQKASFNIEKERGNQRDEAINTHRS